jgi:hypothetical protein
MSELIWLAPAGFLAGFIDAVVGGGGLIQIPVLFVVFPQVAPAAIFGTNKFASISGTSVAMYRYARAVDLPWDGLRPAFGGALVFSLLGAATVSLLPREIIRPVVLALLIVVGTYTFAKKDFGRLHKPRLSASAEAWTGFAAGVGLGFYDGFFGPGTGAFLIFLFIRVFGYDFLTASASAKVVNWATNLAALLYFGFTGNILWEAAIVMAVCNIAGSWVGSHMAIRKGSGFVRTLFLILLVFLIGKFAYDTVKAW